MSPRLEDENPDRLYMVTGGRSDATDDGLDLVTLIVSECDPTPGMQSEHARILRLCVSPMAVVEVAAELRLPVGVARILLRDLLDMGRITARNPRPVPAAARLPEPEMLKQVLVGLQKL
ncbi:DUF742 domain-containing protein [Nonomuraea sp. K274]|uniref:DUF742 domain-containing protein n=1 Tax=Nonomuraea cypriaca TaxID=1187855 RepID=A0A931A6D7_9ACTN|nr:DUF742 domain-containing protein [Nonomuraea cypriaca]MBF8184195.1 DUF742 domain-containing protein [Nonomuraea cypriaca]